MPNMNPKKNPMPSQEPDVRNHNFKEVALGYTEEIALDEAARCLNCKNMPWRKRLPRKYTHSRIHRKDTRNGF